MVARPVAVTLQDDYLLSGVGPHITVDATRGALKIRDNATPVGSVLAIQDNAGTLIFGVNPSGFFRGQLGFGNPIVGGSTVNNVLFVGPNSANARVLLSGSVGSDVMMIDSGGIVNARVAQLVNSAGVVELRQLSDIATPGWTFLGCNLATGDVGIGTTAPASKLDIFTGSNVDGIKIRGLSSGTQTSDIFVGVQGNLILSTKSAVGGLPFIEAQTKSAFFGFVIRDSTGVGAAYANMYMVRALAPNPAYLTITVQSVNDFNALVITDIDKVGVGNLPLAADAKFRVEQRSASAAIPVVDLEQLDIDDTFINYVGTSAGDGSRSISSDTTEDSAKFGAFRVEINGVTKWVRVYDDHS